MCGLGKNVFQMHFPWATRNIALGLQEKKVKETENYTVFSCSPCGYLDKKVEETARSDPLRPRALDPPTVARTGAEHLWGRTVAAGLSAFI